MKIAATACLHGYLPDVPECDVLVVAGDIGPAEGWYHDNDARAALWFFRHFIPWARAANSHVVMIAGNHDAILERNPDFIRLQFQGEFGKQLHYLQDSGCEIDGVKFWGSPWTPPFFDWAFMKTEEELAEVWAKIPHDVDVLVTHGPPYGWGDLSQRGEHCGSKSLEAVLSGKLMVMPRPRAHFFGHIHECGGQVGNNWANVCHVDERYRPTHPIQVFNV